MSLNHLVPSGEYVSPSALLIEMDIQSAILEDSDDQNEEVGGQDDPDIDW